MVRKPKRRNPYAAVVRRLGHKIKPSKKIYTRKGRSKHRPFVVSRPSFGRLYRAFPALLRL